MTKTVVATVTSLILLVGCAGERGQLIPYVALEMPKEIPPQTIVGRKNLSEMRLGFCYRPPKDVVGWLKQLEANSNSGVLREVDVELVVPFCLLPACFGTDTIGAAQVE